MSSSSSKKSFRVSVVKANLADNQQKHGMDCRRLLDQVASAEAAFAMQNKRESMNFGHPDPPRMHLFGITNSGDQEPPVLVVAYTEHCVAAQLLSSSFITDPVELGQLTVDELEDSDETNHDQTITCLTVVALEDADLWFDEMDPEREEHVTLVQQQETQQLGNRPSLLTGVLSGASREVRLVIVFGTSQSRLFSVEVRLDRDNWIIRKDSLPDGSSIAEALPADDYKTAELIRQKFRSRSLTPFQPRGGIVSLSTYRIPIDDKLVMHVWVTYKDGSYVRLHHASLFPSLWQEGSKQGLSMDDLLGFDAVVRCRACLPAIDADLNIIPLPKYHPSPLAPVSPLQPGADEDSDEDTIMAPEFISGEDDDIPEFHEALVFSRGAPTDLFPTICFYTSEDQFVGRIKGDGLDYMNLSVQENAMIGATKAIVGGVLSSALGVLQWGLGRTHEIEVTPDMHEASIDENTEDELPVGPFTSIWKKPLNLYAGHELHDPPRQVDMVAVEPNGKFAALADTLGRVLLIDLSAKQILRIWKGCRDSSVHWVQENRLLTGPYSAKLTLYLIIHSRHRRVVEVWRIPQGHRVLSIHVEHDTEVLSCLQGSHVSFHASCYIVNSLLPTGSYNFMQRLIIPNESDDTIVDLTLPRNHTTSVVPVARDTILRLQHLQQMLSAQNIEFQIEDVFDALKEIKSISDLAVALDLLAHSSVLEENLRVEGSEFQKKSLKYCQQVLDEIRGKTAKATLNAFENRINYHMQIVKAYDHLEKFEKSNSNESSMIFQQVQNPSDFAAEAMGWASTYEQVLGKRIDEENLAKSRSLTFALFASSCAPFQEVTTCDDGQHKIYFSDSSRTRGDVIIHVFKPLLGDPFSYNVVNTVFEALGIRDDEEYIQQCLGEWFTTLPLSQIGTKGLFARQSSIGRMLEEILAKFFGQSGKTSPDINIPLQKLHAICSESTDLVRSFCLATICRESVAKATLKKERATYGKVSANQLLLNWDKLLRRIRVCLLVSLRFHNTRLGACPLSVRNVESEDAFSVYEWLARDEIATSRDHGEISHLEKACALSGHSFDPSLEEGDGLSRFKVLQKACLRAQFDDIKKREHRTDSSEKDGGSLLLFFKNYNNPSLLAAHRSLLLSSEWTIRPENVDILRAAWTTLQHVASMEDCSSLAYAVCLEIWQTRICPVYRARLFGFDDVEVFTDVVLGPLLQDADWLTDFGRISLDILTLMSNFSSTPDSKAALNLYPRTDTLTSSESWPPVKPDCVLNRLLAKSRKVDYSALDAHIVVICSLLISADMESLTTCFPAIYECFSPFSLFNPVSTPQGGSSIQTSFIETAVISIARRYDGPPIDDFSVLTEVQRLCDVWDLDVKSFRTIFLLSMYELGKDRSVDELLTRSAHQILIVSFIEDGVSIVCRRLDKFLSGKWIRSPEIRDILGLLDADLCDWVKKKARKSYPIMEGNAVASPIGSTHLLTLRLLSMSASSQVDTTLRVRIHSLAVLSGTLVKALEGRP